MSLSRAVLCVIFPPLAVLDKGCGMALIVGILWLAGWFPGVIAAIVINLMDSPSTLNSAPRFVQVPLRNNDESNVEKAKREGAYIRLADGEVAEVVDDDGIMPYVEKHKRGDSPQ